MSDGGIDREGVIADLNKSNLLPVKKFEHQRQHYHTQVPIL